MNAPNPSPRIEDAAIGSGGTPTILSSSAFPGRTGRGVRIAVVDSGIHASHPHVGSVVGGMAFNDHGGAGTDLVDRLGHGTAVAAAIREKAPDAALLAVKVFDTRLSTSGLALGAAIRWAAAQDAALVNLSLGTLNGDHEAELAGAVADAAARGALVIAAAPANDARWLPGALDGVIQVEADWNRDRSTCGAAVLPDGRLRLSASPYPRPVPGVPPERNLRGVSFAVANATGLLALLLEGSPVSLPAESVRQLAAYFSTSDPIARWRITSDRSSTDPRTKS